MTFIIPTLKDKTSALKYTAAAANMLGFIHWIFESWKQIRKYFKYINDQAINQSSNQSIIQAIDQLGNQLIDQSLNQSTNQSKRSPGQRAADTKMS